MATPSSDGPSSGYRVLDFTRFPAGPFGTRILAGIGAEVIKIEACTRQQPGDKCGKILRDEHSVVVLRDVPGYSTEGNEACGAPTPR